MSLSDRATHLALLRRAVPRLARRRRVLLDVVSTLSPGRRTTTLQTGLARLEAEAAVTDLAYGLMMVLLRGGRHGRLHVFGRAAVGIDAGRGHVTVVQAVPAGSAEGGYDVVLSD